MIPFRFLKQILLFFLLGFYSFTCREQLKEVPPDDVEFTEIERTGYYPYQHPKNKDWIDEIQQIEKKHQSFMADINMRLDRYYPKKETLHSDGKIYFSKSNNRLKVQLMDSFFGMVYSEILANPDSITLKSSRDPSPTQQPMGDIMVYDPGKNKNILIPFPVIYYFIQGNYLGEFSKNKTLLDPEKKSAVLIKGKDQFIYFFQDDYLQSIEWYSPSQNTRAIAKLVGKPTFPPNQLLTKILEEGLEKEVMVIHIQLKNIQRKEPPTNLMNIP